MLGKRTGDPCDELREAFSGLARASGMRTQEIPFGDSGALLLGELGNVNAPAIALAAGLHGDEPAGPWALIAAARLGALDPHFSYLLWPCLNPSGYGANTRENADGADVNRAFSSDGTTAEARAVITALGERRFVLSIDLHEDRDADGFYCYVAGRSSEALGHAITGALERERFPLQDLTGFDFAEPGQISDKRRCEHGVVVRGSDERGYFEGLCYNLFMLRRHARHIVTMESPLKAPLRERVEMLQLAVAAAIGYAKRYFRC